MTTYEYLIKEYEKAQRFKGPLQRVMLRELKPKVEKAIADFTSDQVSSTDPRVSYIILLRYVLDQINKTI